MSTLLIRAQRLLQPTFSARSAAAAPRLANVIYMSSSATHRLSSSPPADSSVQKKARTEEAPPLLKADDVSKWAVSSPPIKVPAPPPAPKGKRKGKKSPSPRPVPAAAAAAAAAASTSVADADTAATSVQSPSGRATPPHLRAASPTLALRPAGTAGESSSATLEAGTSTVPTGPAEPRWPLGPSNRQKKLDQAAERKTKAHLRKKREVHRPKQLAKFGEDPIFYDIVDLIGRATVDKLIEEEREFEKRYPRDNRVELELEIQRLSAHGDGLAVAPEGDWVICVPKTLPGEIVRVRIWSDERLYSKGDLLEVVKKAPNRKEVSCKYFASCNGCQYQTLAYEEQLEIKRNVVSRAFVNYSHLDASLLPSVLPTLASPKQFGYRTKLTPHFELPKAVRAFRKSGAFTSGAKFYTQPKDDPLQIGFDNARGNGVVDIEECPLATKTINDKLAPVRQQVRDAIGSYKNGATLLFRDSLREFDGEASEAIMDSHQVVKEQVGSIKFESPAGAFFQNNRSILPSLVEYVKEAILAANLPTPAYLVDTYCGSGFFALCLADLFKEVKGVELSKDSIVCAKKNATLNGISNVDFLAASAEEIFKQIKYPAEATTVIIDPPRRGCDDAFLTQLLKLSPELIVYVSCNAFTVARDVGIIVKRTPAYEVVSIRAADLFPQSWHPEVVTVLRKRKDGAPTAAVTDAAMEGEKIEAPADAEMAEAVPAATAVDASKS